MRPLKPWRRVVQDLVEPGAWLGRTNFSVDDDVRLRWKMWVHQDATPVVRRVDGGSDVRLFHLALPSVGHEFKRSEAIALAEPFQLTLHPLLAARAIINDGFRLSGCGSEVGLLQIGERLSTFASSSPVSPFCTLCAFALAHSLPPSTFRFTYAAPFSYLPFAPPIAPPSVFVKPLTAPVTTQPIALPIGGPGRDSRGPAPGQARRPRRGRPSRRAQDAPTSADRGPRPCALRR
jgi:hypothetical protein